MASATPDYMVTFPVAEHHCPVTGTELYCLVTEARVCEQLAQGRYPTAKRPELNSRPLESQANALTNTAPGHVGTKNSRVSINVSLNVANDTVTKEH